MGQAPTLVWIRRDLRLSDHAALSAAAARGGPVIPVFIRDETLAGLGAAPRWRLGLGIETFAAALAAAGSRLILRTGPAQQVLDALLRETGADAVFWQRAYEPAAVARDTAVKTALREAGTLAQSFAGHVLFEPWTAATGSGGPYKVYTPFWNAVRGRDVPEPLPAPRLPAPGAWPASEALDDWGLEAAMNRGADVVRPYLRLGEVAARDRLAAFAEGAIARYRERRDLPAEDGTSGLSENLALGEISPAQCWHAGWRAMQEGKPGAETWLKELVWREFAYHLMWHTPRLLTDNWREEWNGFPWNRDTARPEVIAWQRGRTGIRLVDAAMRELYVTGRMHNRARMIVASYLTKHLLCHWQIGLDWFADCLVDWDPAANALGWQWTAGSGPDAAPYFRVFNPDTQAEKFDPEGRYRRRWLAEGTACPSATALSYFDAVPRRWALSPDAPYPAPVVGLAEGRQRALDAYQAARG
ncbi:MAG: deoxyribodipyrimidine photo-lyase [Roseivivax sp.]|nr:deoxyribodipyrimidine photo-lyase [Roseivivax sp.]